MQKKFETKSANNFFCYDKLRREFLRLAGEHPEDNLYIEKQFEKCLKDLPAGTVINTKRNGSFEKTKNNTFRTIGLSQLYTVLPEILFQVFQCEVSGIKIPYLLDINCLPIICSNRKDKKMIKRKIISNSKDFDKFDFIEKYMPDEGEGDSRASQIATAINKLVYKWFNDGDVFDNTYYLKGWANDLSSYANWLNDIFPFRKILKRIRTIKTDDEYEDLLYDLCESAESIIDKYANDPVRGSIYDNIGFPYHCEDRDDEEDDYYDADHAAEWMERHPHGYYNSENDYGTDADDYIEESSLHRHRRF